MKTFDYVVHSTDENHYNRVRCSLPHPITMYSKMIVTTLTTMCRMILIEKGDSITFWQMDDQNVSFMFDNDYTNLDTATFIHYLNGLIKGQIGIIADVDGADRITLYSSKPFGIVSVSHSIKLLMGLYNHKEFPLMADEHAADVMDIDDGNDVEKIRMNTYYAIEIKTVGFTQSTPVMYLLSNIGEQCFHTIDNNLVSGTRIVMKLNNSFSYGSPIIHPNGDFETLIPSGDVSNLEFILVDAYLNEIKLLSPMYLTIHVTAIDDEELPPYPTSTTVVNVPSYYDYIPRDHLKTKDEDKQPTFNDAINERENEMKAIVSNNVDDGENGMLMIPLTDTQIPVGYMMNKPYRVPTVHSQMLKMQLQSPKFENDNYDDIKQTDDAIEFKHVYPEIISNENNAVPNNDEAKSYIFPSAEEH